MLPLLPSPATPLTVTGDAYFHFRNIAAFHFRYFFLQIAGQRIAELNHPTAAKTDQVMVLPGWFHLIVMVAFAKVQLIYQVQVFEYLQSTIYRGKAEAWLPFMRTPENLIGIKVPLPLTDNSHNQGSLTGISFPGVIKFPAARGYLTALLHFLMLMQIICNNKYILFIFFLQPGLSEGTIYIWLFFYSPPESPSQTGSSFTLHLNNV